MNVNECAGRPDKGTGQAGKSRVSGPGNGVGMECISISFRTAPEEIRRKFSLSEEQKRKLIFACSERLTFPDEEWTEGGAFPRIRAVVLATCNRTEVYVQDREENPEQTGMGEGPKACPLSAVALAEELLARQSGLEETRLRRYASRYSGKKALEHLYDVTCGMDSMVVGEDEILGQVRRAYQFSCALGKCGYELNMAFQGAIACAKRIKTSTGLSRTSVSVATLAASEVFHFLGAGRRERMAEILLLGGSGRMGGILLKNLLSREGFHIRATRRLHGLSVPENDRLTVVDYRDRYRYLDQADVIISATESPHYTITAGEARKVMVTEKERLFLDIAVPADLDGQIGKLSGCRLIGIDDFERLARDNNEKKRQAVLDAGEILEEELDELCRMLAFHRAGAGLERMKERFGNCSFEKLLYYLRDHLDASSFEAVLDAFGKED